VVTYALWVVQGLLALLFLFAGSMKLVLPLEALQGPVVLPGPFVRFIGVAEILGALGLILPGLLRMRPGLTPLAAAGLVLIMIGATVVTVAGGQLVPALIPVAVWLLAEFVAYGLWSSFTMNSSPKSRWGQECDPSGGRPTTDPV
jgi:hypothetical protein